MRDPAESQTPQVPAPRGRPFANGNPGRKPGSKNRTTLVAAALLEGEAEELVRKAVELAKAGDVAMLKFLLGRLLPRERLIKLDLPRMEFADDAVEALGIMCDVSEGRMTPSEGAAVAPLINFYTRAIDMADVVKRLDSLEAQIRGGRVMSQTRLRQIAHLEELAQPYIERRRQIEKAWRSIPLGAASTCGCCRLCHSVWRSKNWRAIVLRVGTFHHHRVWKERCDKWEAMELKHLGDEWKEYGDKTLSGNFEFGSRSYRQCAPYNRDGAMIRGTYLRHELIARFSGATEKEKLERVFASAPPWLIWFTFADYTAELLGLSQPDLSSVAGFARSKTDFDNWYGLPSGAFVPRPWPDGPDNEPLARTDLNLLRPATGTSH